MSYIGKIIGNITKPKLSELSKESAEKLRSIEEENVFHSKTLEELFTEKYDYKGSEPNTIYVKNLLTGEPAELKVEVNIESDNRYTFSKETYRLLDSEGNKAGEKTFSYRRKPGGRYVMYSGDMDNFSKIYGGVGIRLDQMQIERAMQLGVDYIPRESLPHATLYHTKMGYLPVEKKLVELKKIRQVQNFTEEEFRSRAKSIPLNEFDPVIVQKGRRFFLDVNKTQTLTNLKICKKMVEEKGLYRILNLSSTHSQLALTGKELQKWKEIIKGHEILPKLNFLFPKF